MTNRDQSSAEPKAVLDHCVETAKGVLDRLAAVLERTAATDEDRRALLDSHRQLDELFLVVVVGEFNAGKSAFLNAVLGEDLLEQGPTPTTSRIHRLQWGEERSTHIAMDGIVEVSAPLARLERTCWVDTPGTNAIDREHERLTRHFVPRADFVLFVTSADRPFTESERSFLESIREWGKKVVFVVNKIDILEADDRERVLSFVSEQVSQLLTLDAPVFGLSAKQALAEAGEARVGSNSGLSELVAHLDATLDALERFRLKLLSPLEVGKRLAVDQSTHVSETREVLREDVATLEELDRQLNLFREDMTREFELRLGNVDRQLRMVENRGDEFFDELLRMGRIRDLLHKTKVEREFERQVIGDLPVDIERQVHDLIDWMVDCEIRQWQGLQRRISDRLDQHRERITGRAAELESQRTKLLESVGRVARRAVGTFEKEKEARRLADSVQRAVASAALLEVGAVGLGSILAIATTSTFADVTGILAAGVLATVGFFVIPNKRRRAKLQLRSRLEALRGRLLGGLRGEFDAEMESMIGRLREATGPYTRFVRAETQNLDALAEDLRELKEELMSIADRVRAA